MSMSYFVHVWLCLMFLDHLEDMLCPVITANPSQASPPPPTSLLLKLIFERLSYDEKLTNTGDSLNIGSLLCSRFKKCLVVLMRHYKSLVML